MTPSRLKRIQKRLDQLRQGKDVQARDMQTALTSEQYAAMEASWAEQLKLRKPEKPEQIVRYEASLNKALLLDGRHEQVSGRTVKTKRLMQNRSEKEKALGSKADSAFEDALEYLREILDEDPSLRVWIDRDVGLDSAVDINAGAMPRVITSRSTENYGSVASIFGHKTRMQIKIEALEMASSFMQSQLKTDAQRQLDKQEELAKGEKLRQMLGKLKSRD